MNQLQQMLDKGGVIDLILGRRREDFILGECLTTLKDRVSNFNSLERHARDLASFVRDLFPEQSETLADQIPCHVHFEERIPEC